MTWNRTGTVTVTNGSTIVTGVGTAWVANARVSEAFKGPDGQLYEIGAINADGQMTLASPYLGATAGGQSYVIVPTQGYIRDLAAQAAALINQFADVVNGAGAGKFGPGTPAAPSIRGLADNDTGMNFLGNDVIQWCTGGVPRMSLGATGDGGVQGSWGATQLTVSYGSGAAPALVVGDAQYGVFVAGGTLGFKCQGGYSYVYSDGSIQAKSIVLQTQPTYTVGSLTPGNGDGANLNTVNMALDCWYGLGISNRSGAGGVIGQGGISHAFDARTGNVTYRGALTNLGAAYFGPNNTGNYSNCPFTFNQGGATSDTPILAAGDLRGPMMYLFSNVGAMGSTASATMRLNSSQTTGRSINAGGTVNTSGSDYAEYHQTRPDAIGKISKGQIIGLTSEDEVTDKWSSSFSYAIKSTDPSFVGGDTFLQKLDIQLPVYPSFEKPEHPAFIAPTKESYPATPLKGSEESFAAYQQSCAAIDGRNEAAFEAARLAWIAVCDAEDQRAQAMFNDGPLATYMAEKATYDAAADVARQKVDRIAYSGRVPVNVQGAKPGDYIVATEGPGDSIVGLIVTDAEMDDAPMKVYRKVVGRVRSILPDGRANVAVVIH
jgi:hypothetical protein